MFRFRFPRKKLAEDLAAELLGRKSTFVAGENRLALTPSSGTFLSAPRRTGKSTFMRNELKPALIDMGVPVVYVDLMEDESMNPADLINLAIREKLSEDDGFVMRMAKSTGLKELKLPGGALSFNVDGAEAFKELTVSKALSELADRGSQKKLVMIIDEAQLALKTPEGENTMFALKAARDALNSDPSNPRLLLVCTGSSRSRLGYLVNSKDNPFFGAKIREFPRLGKDFTDAFTNHVIERITGLLPIQPETTWEAFQVLWHRPEELMTVLSETIIDTPAGGDPNALIRSKASEARDQNLLTLGQQFRNLTPLQQAVLLTMIEASDQYEPYSQDSLDDYGKHVGEVVSVPSVQTAISALIEKQIIWRPRRGGYFIDDPMWNDWFNERPRIKEQVSPDVPKP